MDLQDTENGNITPASELQESFSKNSTKVRDDKQRIGLLAGNDISTLIALNALVPKLVKANFKPVIFLANHNPSKKETAHQLPIQNINFYERYLTNNVLYPILEAGPTQLDSEGNPKENLIYTPHQLSQLYKIPLQEVEDINAPEFVDKIANEDMMPILVSIRCYQIAREELIEAQTQKDTHIKKRPDAKSVIWNLHPGKLPEYQGIFSPLYAMNNLQRTFAWTLHELVYDKNDAHKGIDKGPIITQTTAPIDYKKHALSLYTDFATRAADMLYDRIEDFFRYGVPKTPQAEHKDGDKQKYYSHPISSFFENNEHWPSVLARLVELGDSQGFEVPAKIKKQVEKGVTEPEIVDFTEMNELLPSLFATEGTPLHNFLAATIEKNILDWEDNKQLYHSLHTQVYPDSGIGVIDHQIKTGRVLPNGFSSYMPESKHSLVIA